MLDKGTEAAHPSKKPPQKAANPTYPFLRDPRTLNHYQYAYQSPLRYIDPLGKSPTAAQYMSGPYKQAVVEQFWALGQQILASISGQEPPPPPPIQVGQLVLNVSDDPMFQPTVSYVVQTTPEGYITNGLATPGVMYLPMSEPGVPYTYKDPEFIPSLNAYVEQVVEGGYIIGGYDSNVGRVIYNENGTAMAVVSVAEGGYILEPLMDADAHLVEMGPQGFYLPQELLGETYLSHYGYESNYGNPEEWSDYYQEPQNRPQVPYPSPLPLRKRR